jgi:hypothetical protein
MPVHHNEGEIRQLKAEFVMTVVAALKKAELLCSVNSVLDTSMIILPQALLP